MEQVKRSCSDPAIASRINQMSPGDKLKFKNGAVNWWVGNWTNDMEKHEQILVFKDLFRHYEFENWPLRYNSTKEKQEADIKIYFVSQDGIVRCENTEEFQCPFPMDNRTLAVAYAPTGSQWDGHVFINDTLFWALRKDKTGKHELYETLVHELGHTHNMGHSTDPKDLMYYKEGTGQVWGIDSRSLLYKIYRPDRIAALTASVSASNFVNSFLSNPNPTKTRSRGNSLGRKILGWLK